MKLKDWLIPRRSDLGGLPRLPMGVKPGLYHYLRDVEGATTRFHLRVDADGAGLLVAGAAAAAQLHPSGVLIAKAVLDGKQDSAIVLELMSAFRGVTADDAADDVRCVRAIIAELESPGDTYPILNLADPAFAPAQGRPQRPLSADVPLAEPQRLFPLVDRLWQLAIPHVTFIASEGCDSRWLVLAVERAEDLGMIAGVRIRGTELARGSLLADLAAAGADHVDVLYLSHEPAMHDALAGEADHAVATRVLAELRQRDVCAVAQMALVQANLESTDETIRSLAGGGVTNATIFAIAATAKLEGPLWAGALTQAAALVEESAERHDLRLLWYPPVRFDASLPLAEQIRRGPRASGDSAIHVEPDGSVIPARGPWQIAGNLMSDDWEAICRQPVWRAYRHRLETDTHCDTCPGLAICAADCPRDPAGWTDNRRVVAGKS